MLISTYMDEQLHPQSKDAEQWSRVSVILAAALELPSHERAEFLAATCGSDRALRVEVESLLASSEETGFSFIDRGAPLERAFSQAPSDVPPLRTGDRIAHYTLVSKLGEGGMGAVYKATDDRLSRPVAIKVIARFHGAGNAARRFFLEARAASALNHPNIITIHEYDSENGLDFMVMEYVEGSTLDDLLEDQKLTPAGLKKMVGYAAQVAAALTAAHQARIVHRDLKPSNIMVTASADIVKVLDFGLAKLTGEDTTSAGDKLTRTGVTFGTPACMSPEQAKGEVADHRSDIFSFGIILYQMATGRRPFDGRDTPELLYSIVHKDAVPADKVNPLVPKLLAQLIDRCLRKNKEQRVQTMEEVRAELLALLPALPAGSELPYAPPLLGTRGKSIAAAALVAIALSTVWMWPRTPAGRVLNYSLLEQTPGSAPRTASIDETFLAGEKFRLRIESPQSGFLYLVTEGPGDNGAKNFWILYPNAESSPAVAPHQPIETSWYVFDRNPGAEKLWLAFAKQPIGPLEAARTADGEVKDAAQAAKIKHFLTSLGPSTRTLTPGSGVQVRAPEGVLGEMVELRHQ